MSKMTKKEAKQTDKVTQTLQSGFTWTTKHSTTVLGLIVGLIIVGGGYAAYKTVQTNKEKELQEDFYVAEKEYLTKKETFERAAIPTPKADPKAKEVKKEEPMMKATGDLEKDYGPVVKSFEETLQKAPASRAGMMAALHLADLQTQHGNKEEALKSLQEVELRNDLLSALVLHRKAGIQADMGQCDQAIQAWDDVIKNKSAQFLTGEAKLKQALCFESKNDTAKAEALYKQVKEAAPDSNLAKTADKYLQILNSQVR